MPRLYGYIRFLITHVTFLMQRKLLATINVNFEATDPLLIMYSAFV